MRVSTFFKDVSGEMFSSENQRATICKQTQSDVFTHHATTENAQTHVPPRLYSLLLIPCVITSDAEGSRQRVRV